MTITRSITFILAVLTMFFVVPVASAHRPEQGAENGATLIPDPNTSFAYYRQFDSSQRVHTYIFEGQAGQFFHVGINIPQIDGLENYQVAMALLGPGLPELGDVKQEPTPHSHADDAGGHHDHADNPVTLPDGIASPGLTGIIIPGQVGEDFFEPFTQTSYWGRQQLDLTLPESGDYTLVVWNPEGKNGKYVLDTGTEEVFAPGDILRFPAWWLNTRLYFEQGTSLAAAASLLFFGIAGVVVYRVRRT